MCATLLTVFKYLGLNRLYRIPHFMVEFDPVLKEVLVYWVLNSDLNAMEEFEYCTNEGHSCNHKLGIVQVSLLCNQYFSLT